MAKTFNYVTFVCSILNVGSEKMFRYFIPVSISLTWDSEHSAGSISLPKVGHFEKQFIPLAADASKAARAA